MDFNHYFRNEELELLLKGWEKEYPNLVSLSSLGESFEKRPIWLLTLTNGSTGPDSEKPAIWIDANLHATEIAGTTTALLIAHSLITGYGQEERFTRLLDSSAFYRNFPFEWRPEGEQRGAGPYPASEPEVQAIEPGLKVDGYGYIAFEEDVLVTETGADFLSNPQVQLILR